MEPTNQSLTILSSLEQPNMFIFDMTFVFILLVVCLFWKVMRMRIGTAALLYLFFAVIWHFDFPMITQMAFPTF